MRHPQPQVPIRPAPAAPHLLSLLGAGCAGTSGLVLLLHALGVLHMPAAVPFIAVPGSLAVVALSLMARRRKQEVFLHRLGLGAAAGLLATFAYDGSRWLAQATRWFPYNAFYAIPLFGTLMLGLPPEHPWAQAAGWFYHFWNGVSFGIMYALIAGPAPWLWGLAWSMILEGFMISSYPTLFGVSLSNWAFWVISLGGHVFYGVVLGLLVQRYGALSREGGDTLGPSWARSR